MMLSLTPAQRRLLRAQAHTLHPVVMIGDAGLTDSGHERNRAQPRQPRTDQDQSRTAATQATRDSHDARKSADNSERRTGTAIGKILVVYKPAEKPKLATAART